MYLLHHAASQNDDVFCCMFCRNIENEAAMQMN